MNTAMECIPCFVRQAVEAVEMTDCDTALKEKLLRRILTEIASSDWVAMPVVIAQRIQRMVREVSGNKDPYSGLKQKMNNIALDLLPSLGAVIERQPDKREALVRLAIAGNLLDAGSKSRLALEDLPARLRTIWDAPLAGSAGALFAAAEKARSILYLADNAGEIVFDRLLIAALPLEKVKLAVRGFPVINDATIKDAELAGLSGMVPVISNGSDAPGTVLEECSEEFKACFDVADMIISKGQGNYETLSGVDKNIFFLLSVKCSLIGSYIGAPVGALVVLNGKN